MAMSFSRSNIRRLRVENVLSHSAELTGMVRAIQSNCNKVGNATLRGASSIITPLIPFPVNVRLATFISKLIISRSKSYM